MELRRRSWSGPLAVSLLGVLGFGAGAHHVETTAPADEASRPAVPCEYGRRHDPREPSIASKDRAPSAPWQAATDLVLPEPVDAAFVLRALADRSQDHVVVDVRPSWQFAEWGVPSSVDVAPGALKAHLAALPAHARVVIVDRDGTLAVAGAVGADVPQRPLRVLLGGVQVFYAAAAFGAPVPTTRSEERPQPAPSTSQVKKRSAGC
jgi:rhodanese-related sulfurtransferase